MRNHQKMTLLKQKEKSKIQNTASLRGLYKRRAASLLFTFYFLLFTLSFSASASPEDRRAVPVQHNGRVKPFDSFARQTLKLVSGKEIWRGLSANDLFGGLLPDRSRIADLKWIRVDYLELKQKLGLNGSEHFFSLNEISPSVSEVGSLVQSAKEKRAKDLRPSKLEQKAEQLYVKTQTVQGLVFGEIPVYVSLGTGFKIHLEILYNSVKPFELAAVFYFLAFLFLLFAGKNRVFGGAGFWLAVLALSFHTFGLAARVTILSRPPVSNMYESMIFMNWALLVFALIFSALRRSLTAIQAGCAMSGFVMLYANLLPIDSSLDVVVAVLRSNYWLTIHVLTIVSSYGAFGLALGLGHRHLFLDATRGFSKKAEEGSAELIFRVIQLGTLLVGTGTFLGGVWANESWGRFWGWDPKETWALITFLGYLLVVHLKYAKKISSFILALSSVFGFLLVLMTWYGVNFVLGRGLHSYGAGAGGTEWIVYFLIFEATFLAWVLWRKVAMTISSG